MKYHVHPIQSPYNCYLYDVNMNTIIMVSSDLYQFLSDGMEVADLPESVAYEIKALQSRGFLKENPITEICNPEIDDIDYFLHNKLSQLTLQVTRQCNFRCNYCSFTYGDNITNRNHDSVSMSWETAKKTIDFFATYSRDKRDHNIGFYGGEPLLEKELIYKCIEYSKKVFEGKHLTFGMTTNGSLLTPEVAQYLIDSGMSILVSMDGPKRIHDKNRKLWGTGGGTFDLIEENLNRIRTEMPEYFKKLRFNSVIDPANDLQEIEDFYSTENFSESIVNTPIMVPVLGTGLYFSDKYLSNTNYNDFVALLSQADESIVDISRMSNNYISDLMSFKKKLIPRNSLFARMGHSGPCKPGALRFFVNIYGDIFPCEKVSETSECMKIGSIDTGFDIQKVIEQMNISQLTADKCQDCWGILHCTICAKQADSGNGLSAELISAKCPGIRLDIENKMKNLIAISEAKEIFDRLEVI